MTKRSSVVVCHPTLQHAHQLALGLEKAGLLGELLSGIPVVPMGSSRPFFLPPSVFSRFRKVDIPKDKLKSYSWPLTKLKLFTRFVSPRDQSHYVHRQLWLFDERTCEKVANLKPSAVVAFENSALETFRACKAVGALCVLDAPSFHHREAANLLNLSPSSSLAQINKRKDLEVDLADVIITCSELARETYIKAGVSSSKVRALRLGATRPLAELDSRRLPNVPTFVFAGTMSERKSIDLVLKTFAMLNAKELRAHLQIVGGAEESRWIEQAKSTPGARYFGSLPQSELYRIVASSHCLLLPSRFDAFGMVIAEALACGTPVITSTKCGAAEIFRTHPHAGWVVDPELHPLVDIVSKLAFSPDLLLSAREYARRAYGDCTWEAYHAEIGRFFSAFLEVE